MACYIYWLINFKIFENTALGHVTEVPIDIARDRRKTLKKKKKEKRKMRKTQTAAINILLLLLFYIEKFIIFRKHI